LPGETQIIQLPRKGVISIAWKAWKLIVQSRGQEKGLSALICWPAAFAHADTSSGVSWSSWLERRVGRVRSMDVFTQATGFWAINLTLFGKEGTSQQRGFTLGTGKARFCGMPVLPIVGHLSMVNTYFEKG
jgi:hypothetical protein